MSVRQTDGEPFKVSSPKAIRAAVDRYLKQAPINKPWSIVGDNEFKKTNDTLNAVCKNLTKEGKVGPVVHKTAITSEQLQKLFESGQLGNADTKDPKQLQQTAWFYTYLLFLTISWILMAIASDKTVSTKHCFSSDKKTLTLRRKEKKLKTCLRHSTRQSSRGARLRARAANM